ncbi:MAG: RsmD family RNA methyltransferase [Spirochaetes bacterium]|nr:RsmD family RNA methyltransferase [Spirochaetota bacterium]
MSTIRVIAGSLKGRVIPFSLKRFGNADITPQKIKEAFFSIVGDIGGAVFLDLCACSGQMGIEALSRGAGLAVMNDRDPRRSRFLREALRELDVGDRALVLQERYSRALSLLREREIAADIIYADPPYPEGRDTSIYDTLLSAVAESGVLKTLGVLAVQHRSGLAMRERVSDLVLVETREYGSNAVSFYRRAES